MALGSTSCRGQRHGVGTGGRTGKSHLCRDPIACSILDGVITTKNSGYESTRLFPFLVYIMLRFTLRDSWPVEGLGSIILRPAPLDPLAPWYSSSPPPPASPSGSSSDSVPASDADTAACFCAPSRSILVCFHHRQYTCMPGRRVACSHRYRIGRVAIYCATVFCLRIIDVRIPTIPASLITPASGGHIQLPSFLCRGFLPVIFLATLDWKLSRAFSICGVKAQVSAPKSKTA